ncbi:hypothetical protein L228DRAFT_34300 [Xylona heveae TC161]|uniref:Uncharacterized protein n=1 Tax=Xylona heveae (strain CBS 132557 / TC161) TaxID=1328760 RepID=A0A165A6Z4_XYLHT|nr:hypothetical protein L228DRAFT_34300 [Xylona heveae TC161]KZF20043.1 hypothetical protein L228DRAFT_34300 [Xylona heveae TC161]
MSHSDYAQTSKSQSFYDTSIPTYEENSDSVSTSVSAAATVPSSSPHINLNLNLTAQLAAVRTQRIRNLINEHITPLLLSQVSSGLSRVTLVLVPSNAETLQSSPLQSSPLQSSPLQSSRHQSHHHREKQDYYSTSSLRHTTANDYSCAGQHHENKQDEKPEVIGFPATETSILRLVWLRGEQYRSEFWQRDVVLQELRDELDVQMWRLCCSRSFAPSFPSSPPFSLSPSLPSLPSSPPSFPATSLPLPPSLPSSSSSSPSSWNIFRRSKSDYRTMHQDQKTITTSATPTLNIPHIDSSTASNKLHIGVVLQDVSIRITTEMGLYDTRSGEAVVVSIDLG